jgi:hypothetical protein
MTILPESPELCKVFYDRSARRYIVRNGTDIARFPSGKANKAKAQWAAIKYDGADVYEAAQALLSQYGDIEGLPGRILRAARMVQEGKVNGDWVESATVPGRSYEVGERSLVGPYCGCVDYENGREARFNERPHSAPTITGWGTICKHILAAMIANEASERQAEAMAQVAQRKAQDWRDQMADNNRSRKCDRCGSAWQKCYCDEGPKMANTDDDIQAALYPARYNRQKVRQYNERAGF